MCASETTGAARKMDTGLMWTRALLKETKVVPPSFSARRTFLTSAAQVKGFRETLPMENLRPVADSTCLIAWVRTMPGRKTATNTTRARRKSRTPASHFRHVFMSSLQYRKRFLSYFLINQLGRRVAIQEMLTVVKNPPRKSGKKGFQFSRRKKERLVVCSRKGRSIKYSVEYNHSSGIETRDHYRYQFTEQEVEVDNQVVASEELVLFQVGLDKGDHQPFLRRPA